MNVKDITKRAVLNILPDAILQPIKKVHYARTLKSILPENERDLRIVKMLVGTDDCVVDIGANIGVYTKFLSEMVGSLGLVYSIEPVPLTFDILSSNVKKLGLDNIELFNCAVSDTVGTVMMEVPRYATGGENFYQSRIIFNSNRTSLRRIDVRSNSIDSLFYNKAHTLSFIKCDTEGNELRCIKGALQVIEKFMPAWLIELSGDPDSPSSTAREVFELLRKKGYEGYWFDGERLQKRRPGDTSVNYFFLTSKHIERVKQIQ